MAYDNYRRGRGWTREDRLGSDDRDTYDREDYQSRGRGYAADSPWRAREYETPERESRSWRRYEGRARNAPEYRRPEPSWGREWADARAAERWEREGRRQDEARRYREREWNEDEFDAEYDSSPYPVYNHPSRWTEPDPGYPSAHRRPELSRPSWGQRDSRSSFAGYGPRSYRRSDDRILEDVCEELTMDARIDATDIDVRVRNGEVTLMGEVERRRDKRVAEEVVEQVIGVKSVDNKIKPRRGIFDEIVGKVSGEDKWETRPRDREVEPPSARLTPNVSLAGPAPPSGSATE